MSGNNFAAQTFAAYRALLAAAPAQFNSETGLGGLLFFAGVLGESVRPLLVAANITGAASLVVSDDAELGKEALRDGVVDFLVSSLDEALRILKNDLRKKQPTAVAVTAPYVAVLAEMIERGVQPDLLSVSGDSGGLKKFLALGACALPETHSLPRYSLIVVHGARPQLARVDSMVRELMPQDNPEAERWLRLSSRYLGRLAQDTRVIACSVESGASTVTALSEKIQAESIQATVELLQ
jgi:urocanate hydratase